MPLFKRQKYESNVFDRRYSGRINRSAGARFDWAMIFIIALLLVIGVLNLYSAVHGSPQKEAMFYSQVQWIVICLFLMIPLILINYQFYESSAYWIFGITCFLLIVPFFFGYSAKGAHRWVSIAGIGFQPSELTKITLVMCLARYFVQKPSSEGYNLSQLSVPFLFVLAPFVLIIIEPDLGTAMLHMLVFGSICAFVGIKRRSVIFVSVVTVVLLPLTWLFILKDYQRERVLTLIDPNRDPLGAGYHIRQSLLAIGSGKIFGKGYLQGTHTKLQFLPEQHTDFVFSVLAEEWGFVGGIVVLALFFILIAWGFSVAANSKDRFGSIMAFGLSSILFWHVFINVGMVLNIMPVVGVVLPFFSYGRTSVITMMIVVTLLMNISNRRYMFD